MLLSLFIPFAAVAQEAYAVRTNDVLTFYYDNQRNSRQGKTYDLNTGDIFPQWLGTAYDGSTKIWEIKKVVFTPSFAGARPTSTAYWFYFMYYPTTNNLSEIEGLEYLNTSEVTNMKYMFATCYNLTSLDLSHLNTNKVTDMSWMFFAMDITSLDVINFNTTNVIDMSHIFQNCDNLTSLDLSNFNTCNVTDMYCMFNGCKNLSSLNLSNFNTGNVTNMSHMFSGCNNLTSLDISSFNTSNVMDMTSMFYYCKCLSSLNLSNFNTSNVTNMSYMFNGCSGLMSLDVSSFNTGNVTDMSHMFQACSNLTTIYVGETWNTSKVTSSFYMFNSSSNLVGGEGTKYDANHVDVAYAHIDGGPSNPGYLTYKNGRVKICDADDMQRFIDNAEGGTAEMTPCDKPTIDEDVEVDDIQIFIDGSEKDPQPVISFFGGSINIHQNAGWSFKSITFASKSANAVSLRANGNGGINNNGKLSFQNCIFQEGDYTITNSKDTYIDGQVTGLSLINKYGGRIYATSELTHDVNISIEDASAIETDTPIVLGSEGYTLSSADAAHIYLSLPTGYEWKYDSSTSSIIVTASTGVTQTTKELPTVVEAFDATGRRVNANSKGLQIQRMKDGTVRKHFIHQ